MLSDWAKGSMERHPIEARLVRKVIRALKASGDPVVQVYDTEEYVRVKTEHDIFNEVFNLDEAYLVTKSGAWVRLVMGEGWDTICDYTMSVADVIDPIISGAMENV